MVKFKTKTDDYVTTKKVHSPTRKADFRIKMQSPVLIFILIQFYILTCNTCNTVAVFVAVVCARKNTSHLSVLLFKAKLIRTRLLCGVYRL